MDEHISVALIEALAAVWSTIRRHHPDVPGVVLLPAPAQRGGENVLGHFAALRWSAREERGQLWHEVVVVAEHLNRAAADIAETLLHEAAHALNCARGIKDCSASQYHNARFRDAAQEVGLAVERVEHYGFAKTSLTRSTTARYAAEIAALEHVLVHRRSARRAIPATTGGNNNGKEDTEGPRSGPASPAGRSRKAVCACLFIIRVSRATLAATTIRCETCGEVFRLV